MIDQFRCISCSGDAVSAVPRVVLIGTEQSTIYRWTRCQLVDALPTDTQFVEYLSIEIASKGLDEFELPDLIVVVQRWPDEYGVTFVRQLANIAGFTQILLAYGPWCWSDGRSRSTWPIVPRVAVTNIGCAVAWQMHQIARRGERPPLPWTAGRDEIFATIYSRVHDGLCDRQSLPRIAIRSPDFALKSMWLDFFQYQGWHVIDNAPYEADIALIDIDSWQLNRSNGELKLDGSPPQVCCWVAVTGWEDPLFATEVKSQGASHVVSKHLPLDCLVQVLLNASARG